jgi:hypothetical protein
MLPTMLRSMRHDDRDAGDPNDAGRAVLPIGRAGHTWPRSGKKTDRVLKNTQPVSYCPSRLTSPARTLRGVDVTLWMRHQSEHAA